MSKNKNKTDIVQGTFGTMRAIKDFLPAPKDLVLKKPRTTKITMVLEKESIDFFKHQAELLGSSYQRMIRNLLREYVTQHS